MNRKDKIIYFTLFIFSIISYLVLGDKSLPVLILSYMTILIKFIIKDMSKDFFSLSSLFIIHYSMYLLYIPIKQLDKEYFVDWYYLAMDRGIGSKVMIICGIIAIISFICGQFIFECIKDKKLNSLKFINKFKTKIDYKGFNNLILRKLYDVKNIINVNSFSYFVIFVGTIFFISGIWKMGGIGYLISKYVWNSDKASEIGIMTTGIQIAFVGIAISFYLLLNKSAFKIKDLLKWPVSYIFIFLAGIKFIQGGRIQVLMICITLVALYNYVYKKITLKQIIIIGILGMILLGYIGYYRDFKTIIPADTLTMIKYMLGGSGGQEYFLNSYTNFTTIHVINTSDVSYLYGASLLDGLIFLIPRMFLGNKDQLLFINNKLAELNNIEIISPVGGLNLASQNLINGNAIYTIIFMIVIGILFSYIRRYKEKSKYGVLLYSMLLPYLIISFIRNPMHYTIKEVIQFAIVPYIIFIILKAGECYKKKSSI
ncbi:oligosaccharide repeat unit polymerase [Clostridium gasigenes]|uniref:O-antigen polymerase n=1 Tax=Clostridium gasigenes TaxID=94869 RepID=UPI001C0B0A5E|nr:O-antigen polymerase [Clostridium gasigenes]MBU3133160.1 oligosaccharide repeat unit polymerase [Clostridium gasigenes]